MSAKSYIAKPEGLQEVFSQKKGSGPGGPLPKCYQEEEFLETLTEEIRGPYKKCSLISSDPGLKFSGVRVNSVVVEVVVITDVKGRTGAWRPTEEGLAGKVSLVG